MGAGRLAEVKARKMPERCDFCQRRTKMMSFRCRCGMLLCSKHRLPECHKCEYDYKEYGKESIATANPKIIAEKVTAI